MLLILFFIAATGNSQFSLSAISAQSQSTEIPDEAVFRLIVHNDTADSITLKWRLFDSFANAVDWDDYVIEIDGVGFTANVRSNTFGIESTDSALFDYRVNPKYETGMESGKFCVFDPTDSLNTLTCLTVSLNATNPDTLEFWLDSVFVYIVDGDTLEYYEGNLVPLTIKNMDSEKMVLSQNAPNPFAYTTQIEFAKIESNNAWIAVYDQQGTLVKNYKLKTGQRILTIDDRLKPGLYVYRLEINGMSYSSKKMQVSQ